jgi:hypothetical protein
LEDIEPETRDRKTEWMIFTAENHDPFPMDHERMFIIGDLNEYLLATFRIDI